MFTDEARSSVWEQIRQTDLRVFSAVLTPGVFAEAAKRAGLALGRGPLNLATMAWLALSAAMRPDLDFQGVLANTFAALSVLGCLPKPRKPRPPRSQRRQSKRETEADAAKAARRFQAFQAQNLKSKTDKSKTKIGKSEEPCPRSKHDPRVGADVMPSEEAFAQARAKVPRGFWVALLEVLGEALEALHGERLKWNGFRLLVLDGTSIALNRWAKLGDYFGYARNQHSKGKKKPKKAKTAKAAKKAKAPKKAKPAKKAKSAAEKARATEKAKADKAIKKAKKAQAAEKAKAAKKAKADKAARKAGARPQARLVMLMLGTMRMPWRYELTPRSQGESTVAARLLKSLRINDLLLMDRAFFQFGLFTEVQEAGAFFAIRRTRGLCLRVVRRISKNERIMRWTPVARKWGGMTIDLRVVDYQIKGFRKTAIVTNLLDETLVTREQLLGLSESEAWVTESDAAWYGLYHRRWEIETAFREIKVVQRMEGTLRGRTTEAIEYEVAGHLILYVLTRWLIVQAAKEHGVDTSAETNAATPATPTRPHVGTRARPATEPLDPLELSFTEAKREILNAANLLPDRSPRQRRHILDSMLRNIAETRIPCRPGRHYSRPNDGKTRKTGAGYRIRPGKLARSKA